MPVEVAMTPVIQIAGVPQQLRLAPGETRQVALRVTNAGASVDAFSIALEGLPEGWYTLADGTASLFPGDSAQIGLSLHPPAAVTTVAGPHAFEVTAASLATAEVARLAGDLEIAAAGRLGVEVRPQRAQGRSVTFRVIWQNRSNATVAAALEPRDAEEGLHYRLDPDGEVEVAPGEEASVEVRVWPHHRETVGEPHPYAIEFRGVRPGTSDPLEPALIGRAQYTYVPRFRALMLPLWLRRLPGWALLLLLLSLLALLLLAGNRTGPVAAGSGPSLAAVPAATTAPTPAPTVTATVVPLPRVAGFGLQIGATGAVAVAWSVAGARQVSLDGRPVAPRGSLPIAVGRGRTLVLRATDVGGSVAQILQVAPPPTRRLRVVRPPQRLAPPSVGRFTARPDPRSGALILAWRTGGADRVLLNKRPVAAAGSMRLPPGGPSSYVLRAQNGAGMASSALVLPASPPPLQRTQVLQLPDIAQFALQAPRHGRPYTLAWRTRHARRVTLNGAAVAVSGSMPLSSPIRGARYVLAAGNARGQVTARLDVVVR